MKVCGRNFALTSLEIAEVTGKPHNDVLKAIRKMEPAWKKIAASNFRLGTYKDANGQLRPCYQLTKTGNNGGTTGEQRGLVLVSLHKRVGRFDSLLRTEEARRECLFKLYEKMTAMKK